jgi:hypothetical protein
VFDRLAPYAAGDVVIAAKLATPFSDGLTTAHPDRMEAANPDFERLKSPFYVVSVGEVMLAT